MFDTPINEQHVPPEQRELIELYQTRIQTADEKFNNKMQEIREATQASKDYMPDSSTPTTIPGGNTESSFVTRSKYWSPIGKAIANKIKSDLTANPIRFEWAANKDAGYKKARAYRKMIEKYFAEQNMMSEYNKGMNQLLTTGTMVAEPISDVHKEKFVQNNGENEAVFGEMEAGRYVGFRVYKTQNVLVDWRAVPGDVQNTAEWCVITAGRKSPKYLEEKYGVDIEITPKEFDGAGRQVSPTILKIDSYQRSAEEESGVDEVTGIMVRYYYTGDGYYYVIADDGYVLEKRIVSSGIADKIPMTFTPLFMDPDNPYGRSIYEELRPAIEIVSTAVNQIADMNALRVKSPFFTFKGMLPNNFSLDEYNFKECVEVEYDDVIQASMLAGNGQSSNLDINKVLGRLQVQEVTPGDQYLLETAMADIWYVTGLNPTALGGMQQKQIRTSNVGEIIANSSLRSSSDIVRHIETYFMNPITRAFTLMFGVYFDDFKKQMEKLGIESRDEIMRMRDVRVVNGSYLPGDQMDRMQKAMFLQNMMQANKVIDPKRVTEYIMDAVGFDANTYIRDNPLELLSEGQLDYMVGMVQQQGVDRFAEIMKQMAQKKDTDGMVGRESSNVQK